MKGSTMYTQTDAPVKEDWKQLIDLSFEFRSVKCWEYMGDEEVFGVQNPDNGEIGYCFVMGMQKELFGLAVYRGTEGLLSSPGIREDEDTDTAYEQRALLVTFEGKGHLEDFDIKLYKQLGVHPGKSGLYPVFRDYQPGYLPWPISKDDARYLIHLLPQAIDVAERVHRNPRLVFPENDNYFFVRVPRMKNGTVTGWRDEWKRPAPVKMIEPDFQVDTSRRLRVMNSVPEQSGSIEVDYFYHPNTIIQEDPRYYIPQIIIAVDGATGLILHHDLAKPGTFFEHLQNTLFTAFETRGSLPESIYIRKPQLKEHLVRIVGPMKIKVRKKAVLTYCEDVRYSMEQFFRSKGGPE
jgi:hypothetical protein